MKYAVTVDGHTYAVEIDGTTARIDGDEVPVELIHIGGTPAYIVASGERRVSITAARQDAEKVTIWTDRYRFEAEAVNERTRAIREHAAARSGPAAPAPLVAPMPGLVVRVHVAPGDTVRAGQGLVVMEAMKMENELRSAGEGTVKAVRVSAGTAVEKGAVLVELE
jgi:pyruvate carboxylase subunit B